MITLKNSAVMAAGIFAASLSHATLVDFETDGNGASLSGGDYVTAGTYTGNGVTFSTNATIQGNSGTPSELMIFNSASPTGGEADLLTPGTGAGNTVARNNVLIVSANNDQVTPNANFKAADIFIDFAADVQFDEIGLLDVDKAITVTLFDSLGGQLAQLSANSSLGNNSYQSLIFNQAGVRSATVALGGDSAITHIDFSSAPPPPPPPPPPVPVSEPGILGLLAVALAGMRRARMRVRKS